MHSQLRLLGRILEGQHETVGLKTQHLNNKKQPNSKMGKGRVAQALVTKEIRRRSQQLEDIALWHRLLSIRDRFSDSLELKVQIS